MIASAMSKGPDQSTQSGPLLLPLNMRENQINEPQYQKTYFQTCTQSDQNLHWAHFEQPRLRSFFFFCLNIFYLYKFTFSSTNHTVLISNTFIQIGLRSFFMQTLKINQTARMCRLVWVYWVQVSEGTFPQCGGSFFFFSPWKHIVGTH